MQRLTTSRFLIAALLALIIFCSGASGHNSSLPASATTHQPPCDCQKPTTESPAGGGSSIGGANIVARMLKMY